MIERSWTKNELGYIINGELTRDTVPLLWQELKHWQPTETRIELSFNNTERVDSAGMVLLIHLIQHAKRANCHIMLSSVPEQLHTLFQLSNIETMLVDHIKK